MHICCNQSNWLKSFNAAKIFSNMVGIGVVVCDDIHCCLVAPLDNLHTGVEHLLILVKKQAEFGQVLILQAIVLMVQDQDLAFLKVGVASSQLEVVTSEFREDIQYRHMVQVGMFPVGLPKEKAQVAQVC